MSFSDRKCLWIGRLRKDPSIRRLRREDPTEGDMKTFTSCVNTPPTFLRASHFSLHAMFSSTHHWCFLCRHNSTLMHLRKGENQLQLGNRELRERRLETHGCK